MNSSSGMKSAASGGKYKNCELSTSIFLCAMFSCAIEGHWPNAGSRAALRPASSSIVMSLVTMGGGLLH
eukprot:7224001-Ditylum_brightwellii.AAC.2